jgi:hypothetical protein
MIMTVGANANRFPTPKHAYTTRRKFVNIYMATRKFVLATRKFVNIHMAKFDKVELQHSGKTIDSETFVLFLQYTLQKCFRLPSLNWSVSVQPVHYCL